MQRQPTTNFIQPSYTVVENIGGGSYGDVFKAKSLNKTVAIKRIKNVFKDIFHAHSLLREIKLLRFLNGHPNIISLNHINLPDDPESFKNVELVFDFMPTNLHRIIYSQQFLTETHVQYILYQLLCGTNYLHSAGVVHRDLKPSNILIDQSCKIKICDFGLAKALQIPTELEVPTIECLAMDFNFQANPTVEFRHVRRRSEHVVTRWYRGPEIIFQEPYSFAVDMWSIGCILAELLHAQDTFNRTGDERKPLFPGSSCFPVSNEGKKNFFDKYNQYNAIINILGSPDEAKSSFINKSKQCLLKLFDPRKPIPWQQLFPGLNPNAEDLLSRLLAFNPCDRITAAEALEHPYIKKFLDNAAELKVNIDTSRHDYIYLAQYYAFEKMLDEEKQISQSNENVANMRKLIMQEIKHYHPTTAPVKPVIENNTAVEVREEEVKPVQTEGASNTGQSNLLAKSIFSWAAIVQNGLENGPDTPRRLTA